MFLLQIASAAISSSGKNDAHQQSTTLHYFHQYLRRASLGARQYVTWLLSNLNSIERTFTNSTPLTEIEELARIPHYRS
jgi:hypothetical protein